MAELTKQERDALIERMNDLDERLYPDDPDQDPDQKTSILLREEYYQVKAEYADRLPRMLLSRCPHTGEDLLRVFDPFGMDGPWWQIQTDILYEEPRAPETFQVLLGAADLQDREPIEVRQQVQPGPGAPFVVPRLLGLPGMQAVIGRRVLATGDVTYPIAYFSPEEIAPIELHQPWCRQDYWFKTEDGDPAWSVSNDLFDFDLEPWLKNGQLFWTDLEDPEGSVLGAGDGICPFVGLPGLQERQQVGAGDVFSMGLPTGEPPDPFA